MKYPAVSLGGARLVRHWWIWVLLLMAAYLLLARAPLPLVQSWWIAGQENWADPWHRRHRMADWMVLTRSLPGLTRTEVIARLGAPPPTDYFRDWSMVYNLGAERGFISIDSEWLVIRLDESDRVSEARMVTD